MKLPNGVKIRVNNKFYRGECPDEFVSDGVKTLIDDQAKRQSKAKSKNKELAKKSEDKKVLKELKKAEDKKIISDATDEKEIKEVVKENKK